MADLSPDDQLALYLVSRPDIIERALRLATEAHADGGAVGDRPSDAVARRATGDLAQASMDRDVPPNMDIGTAATFLAGAPISSATRTIANTLANAGAKGTDWANAALRMMGPRERGVWDATSYGARRSIVANPAANPELLEITSGIPRLNPGHSMPPSAFYTADHPTRIADGVARHGIRILEDAPTMAVRGASGPHEKYSKMTPNDLGSPMGPDTVAYLNSLLQQARRRELRPIEGGKP